MSKPYNVVLQYHDIIICIFWHCMYKHLIYYQHHDIVICIFRHCMYKHLILYVTKVIKAWCRLRTSYTYFNIACPCTWCCIGQRTYIYTISYVCILYWVFSIECLVLITMHQCWWPCMLHRILHHNILTKMKTIFSVPNVHRRPEMSKFPSIWAMR